MNRITKQIIKLILPGLLMMVLLGLTEGKPVMAVDTTTTTTATAVSIGAIDYEMMNMYVDRNSNTIVYYSTDKTVWNELEAEINTSDEYIMDISWVSSTAATTLYFKGDVITTVVSVTLPKQNTSIKVTFNKVEGDLTFENIEDATYFQWRNETDYTWNTVSLEEDSASYVAFLNKINEYRNNATKIVVRTSSVYGTGTAVGARASKEITVSITARGSFPIAKVNIKQMTVNTSTAMEYYDETTKSWVECTKNMPISELAEDSLYSATATSTTVSIRYYATSSKPYSKTATLVIPVQRVAPTVGDSKMDVTYYYSDSKLILQFPTATNANIYEYTIVEAGSTFDETKANWKTVKKTTAIKLNTAKVPAGSVIYVRKAGTAENISKNISLVLPSACNTISVTY